MVQGFGRETSSTEVEMPIRMSGFDQALKMPEQRGSRSDGKFECCGRGVIE